jgi:hypothetical protein
LDVNVIDGTQTASEDASEGDKGMGNSARPAMVGVGPRLMITKNGKKILTISFVMYLCEHMLFIGPSNLL